MTSRNQELTRRWFERRHHDYQVHIVDAQQGLYENVGPVLGAQVQGRALVVGSGPMLNFAARAQQAQKVVCLDLAHAPLKRLARSDRAHHVLPLCADAAHLPVAPGSFDTVVLPFILHHVAQDTVAQTQAKAAAIMAEAARAIAPGGRVVVLDLFLPGPFYALERWGYTPARLALSAIGQPMMFFQNTAALPHPGLALAHDETVPLPPRLVPTLLLPRWQVSSRWHPARIHCLVFTKKPGT